MTSLADLSLTVGERVRFRRRDNRRWRQGRVLGVENDGSIRLVDDNGRMRAIRVEHLEHQVDGPRGGRPWVPITAP